MKLVGTKSRMLVRIGWQLTLVIALIAYAFVDNPTHVLAWRTNHTGHRIFFLSLTVPVLMTFGRVPVRWLYRKVAFMSAMFIVSGACDAIIDPHPRVWKSMTFWLVMLMGNMGYTILRLDSAEGGYA